ncbi:class I SAM-dependent methyltransferase [Desulfosarcina variabilis]|uniref:class I SAM-dependent methyltransferase n=1 Tax=Desulfosarcina variabilis TaxID=2300 RepID=UPI003AFA7306
MKAHRSSQTAENIALVRAIESTRPAGDRICFDPWARHFLSEALATIVDSPVLRAQLMATWEVFTPGVCGAVLMRSDFIDRCLQAAIEAGIEQLVILGAGFDTRALRLKALGNLGRIFEIDHPATQSVKIDKLRRLSTGIPSHVTYIGIDFETEHLSEKLLKNGYTPKTRSFFIWEGVTYYIPAAAVEATLAFIVNQSGAGSGLVFDYFSPEVVNGTCRRTEAARLRAGLKRFGESITFGIYPETISDFLNARGFDLITNQPATRYQDTHFTGGSPQRMVSEIFHFVHAVVSLPADPSINHRQTRRPR